MSFSGEDVEKISKYEIQFRESIQICSDEDVSKIYPFCCCQLCEIKNLLENKDIITVGQYAYVRVDDIRTFVRDYNEIMIEPIVNTTLIS